MNTYIGGSIYNITRNKLQQIVLWSILVLKDIMNNISKIGQKLSTGK